MVFTCFVQNYSSFDSFEPTKVILEKDHNAVDPNFVSEIDRTMKKYADNLLHALDGISARLSQLESRTRHLEHSVDDLKVSVGNNYGSSDGKMRQLENILREVSSFFCYKFLANFSSVSDGQWACFTFPALPDLFVTVRCAMFSDLGYLETIKVI